MSVETWSQVDRYLTNHLVAPDAVLEQALADSSAAGLPEIQVTPNLGKLLHLYARMIGARRILEIGTLGGYSTIWLARALPAGGRLISLEFEPKHAAVASTNIARAQLADRVEIRIGAALDSLPRVQAEATEPFDFIFIDADKINTPAYFDWAVRLSRPGSVIVVDNVVRKGAVIHPSGDDESVAGMQTFFEQAAGDDRVDMTAVQTVGAKGYDGFALAVVLHPGPRSGK